MLYSKKESKKIKTLNELEEELDAEIEEESTITKIKESIPSLEELKESENFKPTPGKTKSFFDRMKNPFG